MIKLNRDEIKKIVKLMDRYENINIFEIRQERTSGIGISTTVRINNDEDDEFQTITEIDITDYGKW